MRYQVFEDGVPADSKSFPLFKNDCWKTSVFPTFKEAKAYALFWAMPICWDTAVEMESSIDFEVNVPRDCSCCEHPVMMEIREVK